MPALFGSDARATGILASDDDIIAAQRLVSNLGVLALFDLVSRFPRVVAASFDPSGVGEPNCPRGSLALSTVVGGAAWLKQADAPDTAWTQVSTMATGSTVHTSAPIQGDGSPGSPVTVQNNPNLPGNVGVAGTLNVGGSITFDTGGGQDIELIRTNGDPNGVITAPLGSLAMDNSGAGPNLYQNSDGATTWVLVGGGGAFYDTTIIAGAIAVNQNDWNPGALGQNTLIIAWNAGGQITGLVGGVLGKTVTLMGPSIALAGAVGVVSTTNEDAASTAANRFLNFAAAVSGSGVQNAHSWTYFNDGTGARWHQVT